MSLVLDSAAESARIAKVKCWVKCWQITTTDETPVTFNFTDHDSQLTVRHKDGTLVTYTPAGGWSSTARERTAGFDGNNLETRGIIRSGKIEDQDLMSGKFDAAKVVEYLIDWRWPWLGEFSKTAYWVEDLSYTAEVWIAQLIGLGRRLQEVRGHSMVKDCPVEFGDARCTKTLVTTGTVTVDVLIGNSRRRFIASGGTPGLTTTTDFHGNAKLEWVSTSGGWNAGILVVIQKHEYAPTGFPTKHLIELMTEMAFPIANGDTFKTVQGCRKRFTEDCKDKHDNVVNNQGDPFVPGTDEMIETPDG